MKNSLNINIEDAKAALTQTEFAILKALFNKVEDYQTEKLMSEQLELVNKLANFVPLNIFGKPGVGKSKVIEELKEMGFNVVEISFTEEEKKPWAEILKEFIEQEQTKEKSKSHNKVEDPAVMSQIKRLKESGYTDYNISTMLNLAHLSNVSAYEYLRNIK